MNVKAIIFLSLCTTLLHSCNHAQMPKVHNPILFDKQGHRGCRGLLPENTVPAMLKALSLGVHTLEMDIAISKDKKVLLSHEPFFSHEITTTPEGKYITEQAEKSYNLYQLNYDSIIRYDVGLKAHPRFAQQQKIIAIKPLLTDVFIAVKKYVKLHNIPFPHFNIETKTLPATDDIFHPTPAAFVTLLMEVITQQKMEKYVIIQSFDSRTLQYLHINYPTIKTALLIEENDNRSLADQLNELGFLPTIYSPAFALVNKALIDTCHQQNILIIPWTVNDKPKMLALQAMGVDGLITDYPNLFN